MLTFQCKCNFYRAVNGIDIFSKILNFASEKVILELITRKCMPILLYGLESCQLSNGDLHSLDFTYNRMCIKLFKSSNIELRNVRDIFVVYCLV